MDLAPAGKLRTKLNCSAGKLLLNIAKRTETARTLGLIPKGKEQRRTHGTARRRRVASIASA
jgi:hypothetical protein